MSLCVFVLGGCRMLDSQLKALDICLKLDYTITNVPIKTSCIIHSCTSQHDNYLINILPTWGSTETGPPVIPCHPKASSMPFGMGEPAPWELLMRIQHCKLPFCPYSLHRAKSGSLGPSFFFAFFPIICADPIMFSAGPRTERFLPCTIPRSTFRSHRVTVDLSCFPWRQIRHDWYEKTGGFQ